MPFNGMPVSIPEAELPCCPTCGAAIKTESISWDLENRTFLANGKAVRFPPGQAKIFDALWRARHKGGIPSINRFMQLAYAGDIDGGPEASTIISVQLVRIRQRIAPLGYTVSHNLGSPRRGFHLQAGDAA